MKEVIVVTSKTCSPCKTLKTRLISDGIKFIETDIEDIDCDSLGIMSVPVLFLKHKGELKERMDGFNIPDYKKIVAMI